jgi:hypothetical protein
MNGRSLRHALLAAMLVSLPAGAQLYKWTDANGRVQYSDKPPPAGRPSERLTNNAISTVTSPAAPAGTPGAPGQKSAAELEQEFRKRRADQAEAEKKAQAQADEQRSLQAACQQSQRQLTALQSGQRMATVDDKGERRFLEDSEIQQQIQRTQADIQKYCK